MLVGYFEFIHLTKGQCVRKTCRVEKNMTVGRGKNTMQINILVQEECDLAWGHDLKKKSKQCECVSMPHSIRSNCKIFIIKQLVRKKVF